MTATSTVLARCCATSVVSSPLNADCLSLSILLHSPRHAQVLEKFTKLPRFLARAQSSTNDHLDDVVPYQRTMIQGMGHIWANEPSMGWCLRYLIYRLPPHPGDSRGRYHVPREPRGLVNQTRTASNISRLPRVTLGKRRAGPMRNNGITAGSSNQQQRQSATNESRLEMRGMATSSCDQRPAQA